MGFFNWAAPMFHRSDTRWTAEDVRIIAGWLGPFVPTGGSLLDIGGGTGGLAILLARELGANVTVLDPTPEMVRYVPSNVGVEVVLGEAEAMPLPSGAFDAALMSDSFHHLRDQRVALRETARVLRADGGVLVLELDPSGLGVRIVSGVERLLGEPGGFLTPEAMVRLMAECGIAGQPEPQHGASYRFLGRSVQAKQPDCEA
ncbi:MAG: methyltransferase domain-containing protein [Coriobacteriia bacterium]|nr:methyltransferase domain-containing protein [Coriobacteriia bacterium]